MKPSRKSLLLAVVSVLLALDTVTASYLGVASYRNCGIVQPEPFCQDRA